MDGMNNQNQNQVQQMSQEELQKTQVLNLKDVEEAARIEKITSKKPAIIVAVIGAFAILFGSAFPAVQTLTAKKASDNEPKVEKKTAVNSKSYLNCTFTSLNNGNGTDTILNINYSFDYDKLIKVSRTFSMNPTVGNPQGPVTVEKYTKGYQPFLVQINGYQVAFAKSGDGYIVTSEVDLTKFDPTTLPALQQTNVATKVENKLNDDKQTIHETMLARGYTCQ